MVVMYICLITIQWKMKSWYQHIDTSPQIPQRQSENIIKKPAISQKLCHRLRSADVVNRFTDPTVSLFQFSHTNKEIYKISTDKHNAKRQAELRGHWSWKYAIIFTRHIKIWKQATFVSLYDICCFSKKATGSKIFKKGCFIVQLLTFGGLQWTIGLLTNSKRG